MANNLIQLKHNWYKLACFFVFLSYNFHLSSAIIELFLSHGKEIIWFLVSRLHLYKSSSLFFSIVFSNVSRYSTIKDILLHVVSFFCIFSFLGFCGTFWIFWPFIYIMLNQYDILKPDLVSVVTAHMVYFCAFTH